MAAPFGGHPTLAHYIVWLREQGGRVESGFATDSKGKMHVVTKLTADNGKVVIVTGVKQEERLVPTMIGYLNRRLGLTSPWMAIDAPE